MISESLIVSGVANTLLKPVSASQTQQPPYVLIHSSNVRALIARLTLFPNKETLH